jgi:hypothetical protein
LKEGKNVAFTHSLFKLMTSEHIKLIEKLEYTVIIDEECDLIEPIDDTFTATDIKLLKDNNLIKIDENDLGKISWIGEQYDNNFSYAKFKNMCNLGMLYAAKTNHACLTVHLPITLIESAFRVILISYRFEHSIMNHFVRMKGLKVVPFTEVELQPFDKSKIKELIEILDFTYSEQFKSRGVLSTSWYGNVSQIEINIISKIIRNVSLSKSAKKEVK